MSAIEELEHELRMAKAERNLITGKIAGIERALEIVREQKSGIYVSHDHGVLETLSKACGHENTEWLKRAGSYVEPLHKDPLTEEVKEIRPEYKFGVGDKIVFKDETWTVARLGFMQYELHRDNYIRIADSHEVDRDAKPVHEEPLKIGDWVQLVGDPTWCGKIVCEGPPVPRDKDESAFIELEFASGPALVTATDGDEVTAHGWMLHRSCLRRVSPPAPESL